MEDHEEQGVKASSPYLGLFQNRERQLGAIDAEWPRFGHKIVTETCSRRPLPAPWQRGRASNMGVSRPSSAPSSASAPRVPNVPPLGEGSANIVWWSEILGLQDAMEDNNRVLSNQTVEAVVDNLRDMEPARRTEMISQLVAFLGVFLAELLRAINLSQLPPDEAEIIDDDGTVLTQTRIERRGPEEGDQHSLVQKFDPRIPFGSKLAQLQAHLNGFDETQCMQVASHLHVMIKGLRRLAGDTSLKVTDRFQRLEALVAGYTTREVDVPLSLQIWGENQLQALVPYLNAGRTPESEDCRTAAEVPRTVPPSTAASSTDIVEVVNSSEVMMEPEYRVMDANGTWVAATAEQAAEFRAHDREVQRESRMQEEADRMAFEEFQAGMAQQWDDWALSSEMARSLPEPSRKRVRVTVSVGTASGQELGEAVIEGVIGHDQTATVSFNVAETMLEGLGANATMTPRGPAQLSAQAAPQLANFDRNHLPGLAEHVVVFMLSVEGRHWLWQYSVGAVSAAMIEARFGSEIAEAFQLWVALQEDLDKTVKNVGAEPLHVEHQQNSTSEAETEKMEERKLDEQKEERVEDSEADKLQEEVLNRGELGLTQLDGMDTCAAGPYMDEAAHEARAIAGEAELPAEGDDSGLAEDRHGGQGSEHRDGAGQKEEEHVAKECALDESQLEEGHNANNHVGASHAAVHIEEENAGCDEHGEGTTASVEGAATNVGEPGEHVVPGNVWSEDPNDPYYVPEAWRRVLVAWNTDAAAGAVLEDTAVSVGDFEHSVAHGEPDTADVEPSACTGSGSNERSECFSGSGASSSKGGQTDLRSWLKQ